MDTTFVDNSIKSFDTFLNSLYDMNTKNSLSEMLYQSAFVVREILCCWNTGLDHTAFESLNTRFEMQNAYLQGLNVQPSFETPVSVKTGIGGWGKKLFSIYDKCLCFRPNAESQFQQIIDLRRNHIEVIQTLKAGSEAEFKIVNVTQNKVFQFKVGTDQERVRCTEGLKSYQRRRVIEAHLISLPVKDRLKLHLEELFGQQVPLHKQFITSTIDLDQADPFAPSGRDSFECGIPKTLSSAKPRVIQFQFDQNPKRLVIFKKGDSNPYINLEQSQLIDFKENRGKNVGILLHIRRSDKHNAKEFRFKDEAALNQLLVALNSFRQFNHGFIPYHSSILKRFRDLEESELETRLFTWRPASRSTLGREEQNFDFTENTPAPGAGAPPAPARGGPPSSGMGNLPPPGKSPRGSSGSGSRKTPPPAVRASTAQGRSDPPPPSLKINAPPPARNSVSPSMNRAVTTPMMGFQKKKSMTNQNQSSPAARKSRKGSNKVPAPRKGSSRLPSPRGSSNQPSSPRSKFGSRQSPRQSSSRGPPPPAPGSTASPAAPGSRGPPPAAPGSRASSTRGPPPAAPGSRGPPPAAPGSRGPPPAAPGSRGPPPAAPGSRTSRAPPPAAPGSRGPPPAAPGSRRPPPGNPGSRAPPRRV